MPNGSHSLLSFLQVAREGTKKTVFTNFPELCRAMNRSQEHCMAFLLAVRDESAHGTPVCESAGRRSMHDVLCSLAYVS
jgi:Domain found in IF2B/IF5